MNARFLIDGARVRQLAATRQGRVSLGGFAYQVGYAVARLASLYTRRPVLDIAGVPTLLRFDWAEDLDEVEADGHVVLTQCKRISDIGQAGSLADVLLGLAPKWLWTPEDRREALRFRLVCTDPRFVGLGPIPLRSYQPRPGESDQDAVLAACVARLQDPPGSRSDRALWQADAEAFGIPELCAALWEKTEVLYLPAEPLTDDPAGPLFRAEREALALLVRLQAVASARQSQSLTALRTLLHANVVAFDPLGTGTLPAIDRDPRVVGFDDIYYALFDLQLPADESPPFQVVTQQTLEEAAAKPKQPFVARRPRWADVVHGQDTEIKFLEREATDRLFGLVQNELLARLGEGEPLPMLVVLGAPGAGKSSLVLRVAARLVLQRLAVVAAPKLNLDSIEEDEFEPFLQALTRLEEGSLPVLLVLDDPFFADSGWLDLLRKLAKTSRRIAVLCASPDYLFLEFGQAVLAGRQFECKTFILPSPLRIEREELARLHGIKPESFADREDDFLVLAMEAAAGVSFETIVDRIWTTLNRGLPLEAGVFPGDLPWTVRAYLVICYFQRFYLRCSEVLVRTVLSLSGRDQPQSGIDYELRRLVDAQGWSIFNVTEPKPLVRFLGVQIGAAHARIAAEAWRRRPVPAFDVGSWVIEASLNAQEAASEIGSLAVQLEQDKKTAREAFLARLIALWNKAAAAGQIETRNLCSLQTALSQIVPNESSNLRLGLRACVARGDGQSWLAFLALAQGWPSRQTELPTAAALDPLEIIRVANFNIAPARASRFMNLVRNNVAAGDAFISRAKETADHPQAFTLLAALLGELPDDASIRNRAIAWIVANPSHPQVYFLLAPLVAANPGNEDVRNRAIAWIEANPSHPQVYFLLAPLVAANPGNEDVRNQAIEWIEANPSHPQVHGLLAPLVAANPENEEVRNRAVIWVKGNLPHPQVHQLIAPLVAADPKDELVQRLASDWMKAHFEDPRAGDLLLTLIARSDGAEDMLRLGEAYLASSSRPGRAGVLGVLLTAGKAVPRYLDLAFDYLAEESNSKARTLVLFQLSRATTSNLGAAAAYVVTCTDDGRKKAVIRSIAIGIRRHPQALRALLEGPIKTLSLDDSNALLAELLKLGLDTGELFPFIAERLASLYRKRGYGLLRVAVLRNPTVRAGVLALPDLDPRVRADLPADRPP